MSWTAGRLLDSMVGNNKSLYFKYGEDGNRTQKTVGTTVTRYTTIDGRITYQNDGTNVLQFHYDYNNELAGAMINGTEYVYVKNLQGDIVSLVDTAGNIVVNYSYDAWGKVQSITGSLASTIGQLNPMRYRGYYQDTETGLYYLQSRYYDPDTCRMLNADDPEIVSLLAMIQSSPNLFAYCYNNPTNFADPSGYIAANIVGAVIGGIIGVVGGAYLGCWLADILGIRGTISRTLFIAAVAALIGATAAAIGYFIGPYAAKLIPKLADYAAQLILKGKMAVTRISASVRDTMGITKLIVDRLIKNASTLKRSATVIKNVATRPYINSTITIQNILKTGKPVADKYLKSGLKWVVNGSFNGTNGVYELVIDLETNTIVHFLFRC